MEEGTLVGITTNPSEVLRVGTACPAIVPSERCLLINANQILPGGELISEVMCDNISGRVVNSREGVQSYKGIIFVADTNVSSLSVVLAELYILGISTSNASNSG
ncbi:hypothetical protein LKM2_3355 [Leptospira kirschneri serovar Mozdok]|nr:hypothetical protein [Leptospira kirschneri serovar Mozdok]